MGVQVISFNFKLTNRAGTLISTTFNREVLNAIDLKQETHLNFLAKGMQNLTQGEHRSIALKAEEAYGLYDPKKVILFPRKKLPPNLSVNESVTIISKSGQHRNYKVTEVHKHMISLDGNHPLAGQDLIFEIEAISVRDATRAEIDESLNMVSSQRLH